MPLTVKDILNLSVMKEAVVRSGNEIIDKQSVDWVSVIETPVENFVRRNEFVLSTGIGCGQDSKSMVNFLEEIMEANAAGLVLSLGRFIKSIPSEVIKYAEDHQFPIIEIPWEVRFSDIIHSSLQKIHEHENNTVKYSEEIRNRLLSLILQGARLNQIANYVHDTLSLPIIIADKRGVIKGQSKGTKNLAKEWNTYIESTIDPEASGSYELSPINTTPLIQHLQLGDHDVLQMSIYSASELQGYMIVSSQKDASNAWERTNIIYLLEHAATAVALCFLHENAVKDTESRLRDDFVWSLAKGRFSSWDTALSRAKSLGYQIQLPYLCIIGNPENLSQLYQKEKKQFTSYDHWLQGLIRTLEEEVHDSACKMNQKVMTTFQRDELVIFLEVLDDKSNDSAFKFLFTFEKRISALAPSIILSWGISKQYGYQLFHESFQEAQRALSIGRRQKGPGHQSTYADTRIDRALYGLVESEELKQITFSTIGSLIDYSNERGIDLIHTFITYNKNRGNVSQTARQLNLHRQSLLYRLRKIETLTGCTLDDPDDIFLIDLSIRLWTYGIQD
ncbi:PucR family transcriptional regulator [Bacillus sp. FJAT-45350]|uniref:PucR family transcriptional regulator n=1 Tax=Bacillus sp. FJAT-45350 TaxID=2011014 RepID=UPI000BB96A6E|nr:PucR family transcriptional regulator [Bacillus sp. FJAT-45350]